MSRYSRQIRNAAQMIKKYGTKVNWVKPANTTPDATQPWKENAAATPTPSEVNIVFLRSKGGFGKELYHLLKGTDIPTGAPKGLMASVPFTPEIIDVVDRNGTIMKIANLDPVAPDGIPIIWIIEFAN